MQASFNYIVGSILVSSIVFGLPSPTSAQESAATSTAASHAGQTKAERKLEAKASRKEARAKKNAELKKLEDAGYNPARANDIRYPQDIQDAQKKAASGGAPLK